MTIVEQPKAVAYKPVRDLLDKITIPALWLIVADGRRCVACRQIGAPPGAKQRAGSSAKSSSTRRSSPTCRAASRWSIPSRAISCRRTRRLSRWRNRFGGLPEGRDIYEAIFDEVKIAPGEAIERVLAFGAPFQLVEQAFTDSRWNDAFREREPAPPASFASKRIQGVLYLVEDKTRDMTLRQELIGANAAKDQFLALLSHELRNPLSPVIAMVGELEASAADSPEVRRALEVIRRNVELEARLIDDLLDVTRISKGKLQLSLETASVHEILQRSYEICREEIAAKDLKIEFRLRAEQAYVEGDPARLAAGLLEPRSRTALNSPRPRAASSIETLNPSPDTIEIRTTDTGIGIEPDQDGKIFNAFEQGQSSITRRFGGLGLGLAISKAMVDAHGGNIRAESDGKRPRRDFHRHAHRRSRPRRWSPLFPTTHGQNAAAEGSAGEERPARAGGGRPHRYLHGNEDDARTARLPRDVGSLRGSSGGKAAAEEFDLLISDIGLPDRSGYELMQELQHDQRSARNRAQRVWDGERRRPAHAPPVSPNI